MTYRGFRGGEGRRVSPIAKLEWTAGLQVSFKKGTKHVIMFLFQYIWSFHQVPTVDEGGIKKADILRS